jgi:phosphoglycerate dehydrogenase-like enzyme
LTRRGVGRSRTQPLTRGLLDGEALSACAAKRPVLINVGRGDLLSESTVAHALDAGWLRHFVGDVYAPEPLVPTSPLWHHPHVTVTPHNSAVTQPSDGTPPNALRACAHAADAPARARAVVATTVGR